jgi:hypothetical protein
MGLRLSQRKAGPKNQPLQQNPPDIALDACIMQLVQDRRKPAGERLTSGPAVAPPTVRIYRRASIRTAILATAHIGAQAREIGEGISMNSIQQILQSDPFSFT